MMFGVQAPPMKATQSETGHIGCGVRFFRCFGVMGHPSDFQPTR